MDCVFCDNEAVVLDKDMDLWLCTPHWVEMNSGVITIELDEVW